MIDLEYQRLGSSGNGEAGKCERVEWNLRAVPATRGNPPDYLLTCRGLLEYDGPIYPIGAMDFRYTPGG